MLLWNDYFHIYEPVKVNKVKKYSLFYKDRQVPKIIVLLKMATFDPNR